MKLFLVEADVPQCPIAGDATGAEIDLISNFTLN